MAAELRGRVWVLLCLGHVIGVQKWGNFTGRYFKAGGQTKPTILAWNSAGVGCWCTGGSLKSRFVWLLCCEAVRVALGMAGPPPSSSMPERPYVFMAGRQAAGEQASRMRHMLWFMLLQGLFFHAAWFQPLKWHS